MSIDKDVDKALGEEPEHVRHFVELVEKRDKKGAIKYFSKLSDEQKKDIENYGSYLQRARMQF